MLVMGAQHVADILTTEALDAPLRLVEALYVLLVHREGRLLAGGERCDPARNLVVPRDVGDEVLYDRKGPQGVDPYLPSLELLDARLAHQLGPAVDLRAARAAVGCLAVPAHRQVACLVRLYVENRVEDDHPLDQRQFVLDLFSALRVSPEDLELRRLAVPRAQLRILDRGVRLEGMLSLVSSLMPWPSPPRTARSGAPA